MNFQKHFLKHKSHLSVLILTQEQGTNLLLKIILSRSNELEHNINIKRKDT